MRQPIGSGSFRGPIAFRALDGAGVAVAIRNKWQDLPVLGLSTKPRREIVTVPIAV